jgi:hypothetical protein
MLSHELTIEWLQARIWASEYILTQHAEVERRNDDLSIADVESVILHGRILENYPEDPRGPSCLVLGVIGTRAVHVVCGRNTSNWLVVITVYIPTMPKWKSAIERNR